MLAALLCPGPSLCRTFDPSFKGLNFGVNRAALFHPCNYWSAIDHVLIRAVGGSVCGDPTLLTSRTAASALERHGDPWVIRRQIHTDDLMPLYRDPPNWTLFSATSALVLAAHLGATDVRVYGADWTNEPDYDGVQVEGCRRDEQRWQQELPIWRRLVDVLATKGVKVERIK